MKVPRQSRLLRRGIVLSRSTSACTFALSCGLQCTACEGRKGQRMPKDDSFKKMVLFRCTFVDVPKFWFGFRPSLRSLQPRGLSTAPDWYFTRLSST